MKVYYSLNREIQGFKKEINQIFNKTLDLVGANKKVVVSVELATPNKIKKLNYLYRGVERVTDVLSFPLIESIDDIENEADYATGLCNIGEIYINLERAKEQAIEYNHSLKREFCFLALHGFLHLLGYDHVNKQDEDIMFALQDKILSLVNIGRD